MTSHSNETAPVINKSEQQRLVPLIGQEIETEVPINLRLAVKNLSSGEDERRLYSYGISILGGDHLEVNCWGSRGGLHGLYGL